MRLTELLPGSALAARPRRENILLTHTGFALITCIFALLAWALPTFGHDTPSIRSGVEKHVSPAEVQQIVNEPRNSLSDYINDHWHQYVSGPYEGQIGGTPNCIADSYDPETDEYGRWDEETYSWDLSGCGGEDESSSSSVSSSDDGSNANTPSDDGSNANTPSDDGSNTNTSSDDGSNAPSNDGSNANAPSNDGSNANAPSNDGSNANAPSNDGSNANAPSNDGSNANTPSNDGSNAPSNDGDGADDPTGPASTDATLRGLTLTGYYDLTSLGSTSISIGTFNPATTSYSASVDSDILYIIVDPIKNHAGASWYIPGGGLIVPSEGSNVISIIVTAEDGSTSQTYTVTVTRGAGKRLASQPDQPQLYQNAPNPFNSQTVISYFLQQPGLVRLEIFALNGQRVAVLSEGQQQAGHYRFHWNGRDDAGRALASGIYLYRLMTAEGTLTRKLTLLQ